MTREEAIYVLKNAAWLGSDKDREATEEAVNMAIEALQNLSKPNNGLQGSDLISRQDALDMLCEDCRFISAKDCEYRDVCKTRNFIMLLPSADKKQVTGKLKNRDDSLLTADSEACKEQKSKLDLISRQDAIDAVENANPNDSMYHYYKHIAIEELLKIPPAEQKQGKWGKEIKGNGWSEWAVLTCDQCGAVIENPTFETNYCPNCGARMKGGAE